MYVCMYVRMYVGLCVCVCVCMCVCVCVRASVDDVLLRFLFPHYISIRNAPLRIMSGTVIVSEELRSRSLSLSLSGADFPTNELIIPLSVHQPGS